MPTSARLALTTVVKAILLPIAVLVTSLPRRKLRRTVDPHMTSAPKPR